MQINESAAKLMGLNSSVSKQLFHNWYQKNLTIIGIVPDFHIEPLKKEIRPYIFYYFPRVCKDMVVRIAPDNIQETINLHSRYIPTRAMASATAPATAGAEDAKDTVAPPPLRQKSSSLQFI